MTGNMNRMKSRPLTAAVSAALGGTPPDTGMSHIGFLCVKSEAEKSSTHDDPKSNFPKSNLLMSISSQ